MSRCERKVSRIYGMRGGRMKAWELKEGIEYITKPNRPIIYKSYEGLLYYKRIANMHWLECQVPYNEIAREQFEIYIEKKGVKSNEK